MQFIVVGTGRLAANAIAVLSALGSVRLAIEPEEARTPILQVASREYGVPYVFSADVEQWLSGEFSDELLIVSAYNRHIFSATLLGRQNISVLNFHNSLLPRHRGRNAPTWAIYEQDELTGVTWHQATTSLDCGRIFAQEAFPIKPTDTAVSVTARSLAIGAKTLEGAVRAFQDGAGFTPSRATAPARRAIEKPNGGRFDPGWTAERGYAFLRSMDFGVWAPLGIPTYNEFSVRRYRWCPDGAPCRNTTQSILIGGETGHLHLFVEEESV